MCDFIFAMSDPSFVCIVCEERELCAYRSHVIQDVCIQCESNIKDDCPPTSSSSSFPISYLLLYPRYDDKMTNDFEDV